MIDIKKYMKIEKNSNSNYKNYNISMTLNSQPAAMRQILEVICTKQWFTVSGV